MSSTAIRSLIDITSFGIYVHFVFSGFMFLDALGASKLRIISSCKPYRKSFEKATDPFSKDWKVESLQLNYSHN